MLWACICEVNFAGDTMEKRGCYITLGVIDRHEGKSVFPHYVEGPNTSYFRFI